MFSRLLFPFLFLGLAGCGQDTPEPRKRVPYEHVNVFMGTGGYAYTHGSSFPGAAVPNGMAKVGPDTYGPYAGINFLHYSGYWFGDDRVQAFSHVHMHGTGATDYGLLGVMPLEGFGAESHKSEKRMSYFDKSSEQGEPGYYATTLENGEIRVELTASTHAAHHRWRWKEGASAWVVVDLAHRLSGGSVEVAEASLDPETGTVKGRIHHIGQMSRGFDGYELFFELRTRQKWKSWKVWKEGEAPAEGVEISGKGAAFAFELELGEGEPGEMQVGLSYVDAEGARKHLENELAEWDFDGQRARAKKLWEERLAPLQVYGGRDEDAKTFYSALHHAFLMPSRVGDADGRFRYEGKLSSTGGDWVFLNDFSLWDTYRTLHPLYVLAAPDLARDSARALTTMADTAGFFPIWPLATGEADVMLGAPADVVIADAYLKGVLDFDVQTAWSVLRAAALDEEAPEAGRGGRNSMREYLTQGWVPAESNGRSVSATTEYAHADFALANLADALGHPADASRLRTRSKGYRNLFEPTTQFLRARSRDDSFVEPFDPESWDHYAEANAWHSLWMAAHDVEGFSGLFGGRPQMVQKLEHFFEKSIEEAASFDPENENDFVFMNMPRTYYWAANEPDIHAVYLFAQAGRPELTQKYLPWIRRTFYGSGPDGLPGNDDGGTMSAWYVFSALGFYPLAGSSEYIVGAPVFEKVELKVPGGLFTIEGRNLSEKNVYVQSVTLNGAPLDKASFQHGSIKPGGSLVFEMGEKPSSWGRF